MRNIKWNCICNAYNCNKLSKDVYLYQITLENGLKCLHKFRYKSFNIGSWSLHLLDSHNRSNKVKKKEKSENENITEIHFSLWFIDKRQEWQSHHCGMEMIFKTYLIALGLDWSWNEIWKSPNSWWLAFQLVAC